MRRPVTVVLPVRDEEAQVGDCLAAAARPARRADDLRVVVVDDGSTDGTAAVVRAVADPRVRLVDRRAAAAGLARQAARLRRRGGRRRRRTTACWSFVDADVRLFPDAVAGAVAVLDDAGLDLVSPWPRPLAGGLAERLVQPLVAVAVGDDAAAAAGRALPAAVAGRGQRPVPRARPRPRYDRAGGHAAVRGEVLEDIALLRAVKRAGGRGGPVDGSRLAACRMYDGWPALRDGYAKSLWAAVGGSPAASRRRGRRPHRRLGLPAAGRAARVAGRAGRLRGGGRRAGRSSPPRTGSRVWPDALAHPVSLLLLDVLMARSVRRAPPRHPDLARPAAARAGAPAPGDDGPVTSPTPPPACTSTPPRWSRAPSTGC